MSNAYPIIDADAHAVESKALYDEYLDAPFRGLAGVEQDAGGSWRLRFEGRLWPPHPPGSSPRFVEHGPLDRVATMDRQGVDAALLFPSMGTFFPLTDNVELCWALVRAYNNWLFDYCKAAPDRLKGVGLLGLNDIDAAVAEARRCIDELGMKALIVRPNPVNGRTFDDPVYDPFFGAIQELGAPLCIHETTGAPATAAGDRYGIERNDRYFFSHAISHPFEQMFAALSIICGGVLERYPQLKVGFFEAGCGWMPYWLWRLDEHYEQESLRPQVPWLKMEPSKYFQRQCMITCEAEEGMIQYTADAIGDEKLMFATDYPHFDYQEGRVERIRDNSQISDELKPKILGGNAKQFFNLTL